MDAHGKQKQRLAGTLALPNLRRGGNAAPILHVLHVLHGHRNPVNPVNPVRTNPLVHQPRPNRPTPAARKVRRVCSSSHFVVVMEINLPRTGTTFKSKCTF